MKNARTDDLWNSLGQVGIKGETDDLWNSLGQVAIYKGCPRSSWTNPEMFQDDIGY